MVFDNSKENITDANQMMEFLAWNMELCMRTAQASADKVMLFMHMTEFSLFNQPPMSVTQETLTILSTAFPESLGTCVVFNPPAYFRVFWKTISRFIDPKTASKVFLLSGDISSGSQNDDLMNNVIGSEWKQLTGAGRPTLSTPFSPKARKNINASPGFDIDVYWPTVLRREEAWAKCAAEKLAVKSDPVPAAPVASPSSPKRRLSIGSPLKMGPRKGVVKGGDRYLRQQSAPQQQIRAPVPSPISRKVPQQEPIKKTKQDEAEAESEAETEGGAASTHASTRNSWSVEAKLLVLFFALLFIRLAVS